MNFSINITTIYNLLANGTNLSFISIFFIIILTCIISIYIFIIYKLTIKGAFYSKHCNLIFPGICVTSAILTITIQSSILVFVGIVSTLSALRFRHAMKNPLDLLYLLWALCTGIFCGTQLYTLALLVAVYMTLLFLFLDYIVYTHNSYVLTIESTQNTCNELYNLIRPYCKKITKRKIIHQSTKNCYTFTLETKKEDFLLDKLAKTPSLISLSFTSYNGEYRDI